MDRPAPVVCFVLFCGFLALMSIFVNWELFLTRLPSFNSFFDPVSWVFLGLLLAFTKILHEFGHALHGLLSKVEYPSQAGTQVARDYVEFPSQVNEHWLSTKEVLNKFGHYIMGWRCIRL